MTRENPQMGFLTGHGGRFSARMAGIGAETLHETDRAGLLYSGFSWFAAAKAA